MTTNSTPTDDEIIALAKETKSAEPGRDGYILPVAFARAIEQAVLQSPEIQALRKNSIGWKPIETAPQQGRRMILLLTSSRFPQVAWSDTWWLGGFSVENKPTHWMPLPELPDNAAMEQT